MAIPMAMVWEDSAGRDDKDLGLIVRIGINGLKGEALRASSLRDCRPPSSLFIVVDVRGANFSSSWTLRFIITNAPPPSLLWSCNAFSDRLRGPLGPLGALNSTRGSLDYDIASGGRDRGMAGISGGGTWVSIGTRLSHLPCPTSFPW